MKDGKGADSADVGMGLLIVVATSQTNTILKARDDAQHTGCFRWNFGLGLDIANTMEKYYRQAVVMVCWQCYDEIDNIL